MLMVNVLATVVVLTNVALAMTLLVNWLVAFKRDSEQRFGSRFQLKSTKTRSQPGQLKEALTGDHQNQREALVALKTGNST